LTTFTLKEAAKLLRLKYRDLKTMCDDGIVPHVRLSQGYIRFKSQHIEMLSPGLLGDKIEVSSGYIRPKRLISPIYTSTDRGFGMDKYTRNARNALNLGSGLPWEARGVLSMMVDLMAIHDNEGIPCEPSSYIAGSMGLGQRKWTQGIEPILINARKIKRVRRGGIDVYVWYDGGYMHGDNAVIEPVRAAAPVHLDKFASSVEKRMRRDRLSLNVSGMPITEDEAVPEGEAHFVHPDGRVDKIVTADVSPVSPPPAPAANPKRVLDVSAYDLLKSAGIDVDGHPRGVFFWARAEHTAKLREWMETVPLSEIAVRIDKARIAGQFNDHQNSMAAFEAAVMGDG